MTIKPETYLKDIAEILEDLAIKMDKAQSTNICFAYAPDHISTKGKINMCLEYIKKAIDIYK